VGALMSKGARSPTPSLTRSRPLSMGQVVRSLAVCPRRFDARRSMSGLASSALTTSRRFCEAAYMRAVHPSLLWALTAGLLWSNILTIRADLDEAPSIRAVRSFSSLASTSARQDKRNFTTLT
jgi:hypothetical protein